MKFCKHCGAEVLDNAIICVKCGCGIAENQNNKPAFQLNTSRGLIKTILLSFLTFGIYSIVVMTSISEDINIIASKNDGRKTMNYCLLLFVIAPLTLGIAALVWNHKICGRMGNELRRRNINYSISPASFWGWGILGSFILIGPFIYLHKQLKAINLLSKDYNEKG